MPFLETVSRCLNCPAERVRLIDVSRNIDPFTVRNGVVVFFAEWSAPAHLAIKAFTEKLSHLKQDIPVWILNVDTLTEEVDEHFQGGKNGCGESFFFRDGIQVDQLLSLEGNPGENFRVKWQRLFGDQ